MSTASEPVAFVLPYLSGGGAERAVLNLAPALRRSTSLVLAEWRGGELESSFDARNVAIISSARLRPSRATRVVRLASALRRIRPRLVVSLLSPLVAAQASHLAGVPLVHWFQNPLRQVLPFEGRAPRQRLNRAVLRHIVGRAAGVACASPGILDEVVSLGLGRTPTSVIPNPLRLPEPAPPLEHAPGRIVTIGRLAAQKRHDVLLRAVARLAGQRTTRLLVCGSGPLRHDLEAQAQVLGLRDLVDFAGFVDAPAERLKANDVFALCSDFEGFGNVFVEALARGVRIVATDAPYGARYVLGDVKLAELVPPDSPDAVAAALIRALDAGPPSQELRAEARVRAEEFAIDRVATRFEEFLDRVTASDLPRRGRVQAGT